MNRYDKSFRLDGKVALVSGAARGIGLETAYALGLSGAAVLLTDVLEKEGRESAAALKAAGVKAEFLKHDVTEEGQWEAAVSAAVTRLGGLDVVVNNAGIEDMQFSADCDVKDFRRMLEVNVVGVFLGCKHAIRTMRPGGAAGKGGSIINISSAAGINGFAGLGAYNASKGAVRIYSKSVAVECGQLKLGIRCNSVHPGLVKTTMGDAVLEHYVRLKLAPDVPTAMAAFVAAHPIGHIGEPRDIASAVLFLASDASKWMTGSEFVVDGGFTAT